MSDGLVAFIAARLDEDEASAKAATPGPWERPLDVRNKAVIIAALPADEKPKQWVDGIIPENFASHSGPTGRYAGQRERVGVVQLNTWSDGSHDRKRGGRDLEHIARHDPARVLREVEAKRAMLAELTRWPFDYRPQCDDATRLFVRLLGSAYADHPDYREEWKP